MDKIPATLTCFRNPSALGCILGSSPFPVVTTRILAFLVSGIANQKKHHKPRLQYREEGTNPRYTNPCLCLRWFLLSTMVITIFHHHLRHMFVIFSKHQTSKSKIPVPGNFEQTFPQFPLCQVACPLAIADIPSPQAPQGSTPLAGVGCYILPETEKNQRVDGSLMVHFLSFWDSAYHIFRGKSMKLLVSGRVPPSDMGWCFSQDVLAFFFSGKYPPANQHILFPKHVWRWFSG